MAAVARQVSVPIATGERLHTIDEFAMLLVSRQAVPLIK
jgi:L-alanine-DL-glutamate epimerase-like enolase superfamily enzyme